MDQRQKKVLESSARDLADSVNASELADLLQLAKLVSRHRIEDIMSNTDSNFCRNLKLIDALQESSSPSAFDDFVCILERIDPNVPKLINPSSSAKKEKEGVRGILSKMFQTFSRSPNNQYPLGLGSGSSSGPNSSSYRSTSGSSDFNNFSPLKERHQATLISSVATPEVGPGSKNCQQDSGFVLTRRHPNGQLPGTPSTPSDNGPSVRHTAANKFSQTPQRHYNELNSISNLSISEEPNNAGNQNNDTEEPVIAWHPYELSQDQLNSSRAPSPHRCHPTYSSASSESGESTTSESFIVDPHHLMDSNVMSAFAHDDRHTMLVQMATICHNDPDEDYKMTSRPRGKCLIVNNINFENEIFPTRKGSDEDAKRFDQIFTQLGFETVMTRNLTADQMKAKFKELASACKPEHDALFVFILSHGSEHGIYGTDGLEVYLESEIISCFDNRNCKAMLGKPKVFVIQACRGRTKDLGGCDGDTTDSIAWPPVTVSSTITSASQENRVPASWLPSQPSEGKKRKHPIRTDMLLIFSCLAGFVSVRNETAGSWLGVALAYFLMKHAHERDLLRILNLVTSDIIQRESTHGHIQSIELKLLGWTKNLYFNPGIYL